MWILYTGIRSHALRKAAKWYLLGLSVKSVLNICRTLLEILIPHLLLLRKILKSGWPLLDSRSQLLLEFHISHW